MPEFDLDDLKSSWQQQAAPQRYNEQDIEIMLSKSSGNYVKYILWICIAEFAIILGANIYYSFAGETSDGLKQMFHRLGIRHTESFALSIRKLYTALQITSLVMSAVFAVIFYRNYRKINVEENLKKFILQIIRFRKSVNFFILANIGLVVLFTLALGYFTFSVLARQDITWSHPTVRSLLIMYGILLLLSVLLMWVYYRIVYGMLLRRLGRNLEQLKKIEQGN